MTTDTHRNINFINIQTNCVTVYTGPESLPQIFNTWGTQRSHAMSYEGGGTGDE